MSARLFPWSSKGKKFFPIIFRLHKHVRACKGYRVPKQEKSKGKRCLIRSRNV